MSTKALAARAKQLLIEIPGGLNGWTAASRGYGASVPIRDGDFSQLTAKEQGEWYLHTVRCA